MLEDKKREASSSASPRGSSSPKSITRIEGNFSTNHTLKKLATHSLLSAQEEYCAAVPIRARILLIHRELLKLPEALVIAKNRVKNREFEDNLDSIMQKAHNFYGASPAAIEEQLSKNGLFLRALRKNATTDPFRASDLVRLEQHLLSAAEKFKAATPEPYSIWLIKVAKRVSALRAEVIPLAQKFAEHNTRLVIAKVKSLNPPRNDFDDYVSAGNYGLMRAIERFDPKRGYRFSTYAFWWIQHGITELYRSQSSDGIRIPEKVRNTSASIRKATAAFLSTHGHNPSQQELSEVMSVSQEQLRKLQKKAAVTPEARLFSDIFSQDSSVRTPEEGIAGLAAAAFTAKSSSAEIAELRRALSSLSDMQRHVLLCFFGDMHSGLDTLQAIGDILKNEQTNSGVTRERVRQIRDEALRRLRHEMDPESAGKGRNSGGRQATRAAMKGRKNHKKP
jgi:DNA-directed RNA polymerase sigma subunit (sigma70/sigma32)